MSNSQRGFCDLIRACEQLQTFAYIHSDNCSYCSLIFNPLKFYHPLSKHKNTLQELTLHAEHEYFLYDAAGLSEAFLGSLKELSVLRRLHLRALNIINWQEMESLLDVLPSFFKSLIMDDLDLCTPRQQQVLVTHTPENSFPMPDKGWNTLISPSLNSEEP
ncbi:hypothetical protein BDW74DRAFT_184066 [Aspergillus multicolor]|uniref:uncharacterized protein n=1 Tax=Aspergillus multicolor TaxID=41759 RepID=UPI003CCCA08C